MMRAPLLPVIPDDLEESRLSSFSGHVSSSLAGDSTYQVGINQAHTLTHTHTGSRSLCLNFKGDMKQMSLTGLINRAELKTFHHRSQESMALIQHNTPKAKGGRFILEPPMLDQGKHRLTKM